jgi:hypothetical protein
MQAIDALGRAITAARAAQRLASAAATAFSDEAEVLIETKGTFEGLRDVL